MTASVSVKVMVRFGLLSTLTLLLLKLGHPLHQFLYLLHEFRIAGSLVLLLDAVVAPDTPRPRPRVQISVEAPVRARSCAVRRTRRARLANGRTRARCLGVTPRPAARVPRPLLVVLTITGLAPKPFIGVDDSDEGKVCDLESDNSAVAEFIVPGKHNVPWVEEDQRDEVERWVEMREARAGGCLEDINAIDVEVFLSRVGHDAGKAVRQHTGQGAGQEDGAKRDEENHQRRAKGWVHVVHNLESNSCVSVEDLGQRPGDVRQRERVSSNKRECREESHVHDNNQNDKLDEILGHGSDTGNQSTPIRVQA